ncbi:GAF domain-containing protein [Chloracidobacterium validum]|uniref:histidine kinase n=1 Tax=Chloracidobacterium validum TaxID=2821543 RepID=A0ABX8BEM2_9BACT|nr:ATP-binding protein [Chloracidobacterium validum]QUW04345.1 GAF domain-containing protein [Chloracidobacterium validum]
MWLLLVGVWGVGAIVPAQTRQPPPVSSPSNLTPLTNRSPLSIAQPAIRSYTDQEGLPQNSIQALTRDLQGRLWAATQDGAAYFDGRTWTPVALPRALGSNFVTALAVTSEGVWFATPNGICRYNPSTYPAQQWKVFSFGNERANTVTCLLAAPGTTGGGLWVGTRDGLLLFREDRWERPAFAASLEGIAIRCLMLAASPSGPAWLWVGTQEQGLWRHQLGANRWDHLSTVDGLPSNHITCLSDGESSNTIWVGTLQGLSRVQGARPQVTLIDAPDLAKITINAILETEAPDGSPMVWVGTNQGLYWQRANQWRRFVSPRDLPSDIVRSLFVSQPRSGGVWIGQGGGGGVTYLHHGGWWSVSTTSGLPSNMAWCAEVWSEPDGAQTLWAGTLAGLSRWQRGDWTTFDQRQGFQARNVRTLLTTTRGKQRTLWIGTAANGLWRLADSPAPRAAQVEAIPPDAHVHCLYQPRSLPEHLYVGLEQGLRSVRLDLPEGESLGLNEAVYSVAETPNPEGAPDGPWRLWAGLDHGVAYRVGQEWKRFEFGLSGRPMVNALHATTDAAGQVRLWCGLQGGGLVCLEPSDPPRIVDQLNTQTSPALPNNVVYHLLEDSRRRLWATTNRGVVCLALDAVAEQDRRALVMFTSEDGLPSNECNFGRFSCDAQGRVWVGTVRGLAALDTGYDAPVEPPGQLLLEMIAPDDWLGELGTGRPLPHTLRDLAFRYTLPVLRRSGEVEYQTQLIPYDQEPTAWTARGRRDCSNLAPGTYTLKVWARDAQGQVTKPATLTFTIQAAPWRQPWAYVLYVVAIFGFGYAVYDFRVRQIRRNQEARIAALRQLLDSTRVINSTLDVGEVLRKIASESASLIGGEPGGIGLVEDGVLVLRHIWNTQTRSWEHSELTFPLGEGIAGSVAATGQARIVNDVRNCPDIRYPELLERYHLEGILDVPIRNRDGVTIGVLDIRRPPGRVPFTEQDCELVEGLTHQAAVAIENAAINRQLREAAETAEKLYRREQEVVARLQELDVMKNNFLAVTSHEMRTPLTVIKGFIEALTFGTFDPLTDRQQSALMTCLKTTDRLARIVEDIFEVLKIQEGYIGLDCGPVMVEAVVRDILEEVSVFITKRHQRVTLTVSGDTRIEADAHKLSLSLFNVIQNAIKFTPDGGEIAVTVMGDEECVTVDVADTGIGIEAPDLPYVFERFYTGRDTSRHSSGRFEFNARGTGLGLTIAKSYIDAHGGLIEAASDGAGQGSRFTITLPRVLEATTRSSVTMAIAKVGR